MSNPPPVPDYVAEPQAIGFVISPEHRSIGLQFVDTAGKSTIVPLSGDMFRALKKGAADIAKKHPTVFRWTMALPITQTH